MGKQVHIEVLDSNLLAEGGNEEDFVREMRLAAAIKWFELGRISQGRAAEIAGLHRREFLEALSRYGVSPFQVTPDELDQELTR